MPLPDINYVSKAVVEGWVDGDTVDMDVDLWFKFHAHMRFRLLGIDTPERGRPGYVEATQFNASHLPAGTVTKIQSTKPQKYDKYGRYLVDIEMLDGRILNAVLIEEGLAVPYDGGTKPTSQSLGDS